MPQTPVDRIDGLTTSVAVKAPCHAATTANITLSGLQTIDGVVLLDTYPNYRVLVKDQTDPVENGIYNPHDSTAWTRALDFDGQRDARNGTLAWVNSGDTNVGLWKVVATTDPIVIDVDEINWAFVMGGTIHFISEETIKNIYQVVGSGNLFEITNEQRGTIATGFAGNNPVAWNFAILGYYLTADVSCSLELDVWIKAWADDDPPDVTNTIVAAAPAALVSQQQKKVTTLTGWTPSFDAGSTGLQIYYNVNSVSGGPSYYNFTLVCLRLP